MRIAVLSLHTSPAAQPGQGDAGGLNVYAAATSRRLAAMGHRVEVFTADPATAGAAAPAELGPGIRLHRLASTAGDKEALAADLPRLAAQLAAHPAYGDCDAVWAHYWISGLAALEARALAPGAQPVAVGTAARPGTVAPAPLAVSFHTLAAVKERDTAGHREPARRLAAEARLAREADLLVANTAAEARDLEGLLGAARRRTVIAPPGVDREVFRPGPVQAARTAIGRADADLMVLCVGRMQHVKGTDLAIEALARLRARDPQLAARVELDMLGAGSGGPDTAAFERLAQATGVAGQLTVRAPVPAPVLADWYRAADIVIVPSRSESFGFAAAEAQAAGACVLASAVGGLVSVVDDGTTGRLVAQAEPEAWARELESLLRRPAERARLGAAAHRAAQRFDWGTCVQRVLDALATATAAAAAAVTAAPLPAPGAARAAAAAQGARQDNREVAS
ncbi:glycosyltransferase [Brevibacterium sp. BRM-1]|uniref:glycosyltransferase n=1 Tax=Brevibacterium sp. BRM-1 TaxID=2999062 RepID=UPI002282BB2D|nr:glycosyltransferase [Brevibacterium sp. BRM-1]WAL39997.1 glycosyltransferase [Brevibacterium sp. BRM-1]